MRSLHTTTLIIGAGPAGLATAMELCRGGADFVVMERQSGVGGLARTHRFVEDDGVFLTDNGPHRFFSKNPYLYDFIEDLLDEQWMVVNRQTRQFIDGKFYDYPVNATQALRNLGISKATRILVDYACAKLKYGLLRHPVENFYDYTVANFGETLAQFNMINYTEKIWGIPASDIHPDWAGQRIRGLSLSSLVTDALRRLARTSRSATAPKTLVDEFFYPQFGTGTIYDAIVARIRSSGHEVLLSTEPVEFRHDGSRFTEVIARGPAGDLRVTFDNLVESVPVKDVVTMMRPEVPCSVAAANERLTYRSQVYLFLTIDRASVTTDQWIYFPSKDTPIARMSEMRNFSSVLSPPGKTSLFVEFFCSEGDEIWQMSQDALFELTVEYLERNGFLRRSEVRRHYLLRERNVYPVYDTEYQTYLSEIKGYLDQFSNLFYIGRPGRFRYNNQDHSLEMGILTAKSILEGMRHDIERIGTESEYFEKGNLRTTARQLQAADSRGPA